MRSVTYCITTVKPPGPVCFEGPGRRIRYMINEVADCCRLSVRRQAIFLARSKSSASVRKFGRRVRTAFVELDGLMERAEEAVSEGLRTNTWEAVARVFLEVPGFGPFRVKELLSDLKSDGRLWGPQGPADAQTFYLAGPGW